MRLREQVREGLGPTGRRVARRVVDGVAGSVVGSLAGVHTSEPVLSLTFDDGPDRRWTPRVLDELAGRGMHASFFLLVPAAERNADLVARMVAEGHDVGLHGMTHGRLSDPRYPVEEHLGQGKQRLERLVGEAVHWFRPPYGAQTLHSYRAARRIGLDVVVWGPHGTDWEHAAWQDVAAQVVGQARPGSIVLLHDGLMPPPPLDHPVWGLDRARAVRATLDGLTALGLSSVTLSELVSTGSPRPTAWFRS
ncbi:MAG TPA: polysaccharide deacetylase family protein [Acidimicrobiales bacterium]|jgi:peptidoglycan/xylan/chitin deacetylase (PgdA/CDA1 family)|nr:polysaccharide deacetylase family protein [Acidimicrobiales bacterium]